MHRRLKYVKKESCETVIFNFCKALLKTTEFITSVLFGHDNKFASILQSYGNSKDQRQIILFDNNSQTIFFRTHLKKGEKSSDYEKESMLYEAKKSLLNINSSLD